MTLTDRVKIAAWTLPPMVDDVVHLYFSLPRIWRSLEPCNVKISIKHNDNGDIEMRVLAHDGLTQFVSRLTLGQVSNLCNEIDVLILNNFQP